MHKALSSFFSFPIITPSDPCFSTALGLYINNLNFDVTKPCHTPPWNFPGSGHAHASLCRCQVASWTTSLSRSGERRCELSVLNHHRIDKNFDSVQRSLQLCSTHSLSRLRSQIFSGRLKT